jgi:hypothetical protein
MPLSTRRSFTRGTPRALFGSIGLIAAHSIGEFVAHDWRLQFGSLNHVLTAKLNFRLTVTVVGSGRHVLAMSISPLTQ